MEATVGEKWVRHVANGISPPKWVMEHVGLAFDRYAFSGLGQDTSMLLKDLGLVGGASGATSPWTERETLDANFRPMMDMATSADSTAVSPMTPTSSGLPLAKPGRSSFFRNSAVSLATPFVDAQATLADLAAGPRNLAVNGNFIHLFYSHHR